MVWEGQEMHINTCQMIDWRKALGLHLWYASSPTSPVSDVMEDYSRAFQVSIETVYNRSFQTKVMNLFLRSR